LDEKGQFIPIFEANMSYMDFSINQIKFSKTHNEDFYKTLRKRVLEYFKDQNKSRFANTNMVLKTIFMCALYLVPFTFVFLSDSVWINLILWSVMGFGMAGIGLSIMHDANHGAYSKHQWINKTLGHIIVAVGGNDVNWRIQHNVLHHTYTNVTGMDEDIEIGGIMRFSPHTERKKGHKYQHIYAWFLYSMMTMMWFTVKDYTQLTRYKKKNLLVTQKVQYGSMLFKIILSKAAYGFVFLVAPMIWSPASWWVILIGFVIMQMIAGLVLSAIFQPAHVVPSSNYPMPDESGNIEADWAVSQLYNTANFAPGAKLFSWYVGGLNYQVEHHLFPNICHIHYDKLSKIVRETAEEFNLPYNSFKTFGQALKEHGKMLYNLGNFDNAAALH
jgi:linoleoyl-CoA desaturase